MNYFLFLDIDGVLNSAEFFYGPLAKQERKSDRSLEHMLDPTAVGYLNTIVDATGAKVVISSSWRQVHRPSVIREALKKRGFTGDVIGRTGYRSDGDSGTRRGLEIQDWLDIEENMTDEPRRFVILDDSSDMGPLLPYLVRTTWERGLCIEHVPLAIGILLEGP